MKIDYKYLPLSKIKIDIHNQCYSQNYAHGKRAVDAAPINTPAGTTVLLSIRLKGSLIIPHIKAEELHRDLTNIWENN